MYGPTETTVWSTRIARPRCDGRDGCRSARPIANTQIYVLDEHGCSRCPSAWRESCTSAARAWRAGT